MKCFNDFAVFFVDIGRYNIYSSNQTGFTSKEIPLMAMFYELRQYNLQLSN